MRRRPALLSFVFVVTAMSLAAPYLPCQTPTQSQAQLAPSAGPTYAWPPDPSRPTITLWPATPPDSIPDPAPEADATTAKDGLVADHPLLRLGHVTTPTLTLYQPTSNPSGTAVVVFPGGGYSILAIDLEGTGVCHWLNHAGIACLVLKYRVPDTGPLPKSRAALDDAQRALGIVRLHAAEWHVNPNRIGVLGFSAGAHLAAALSTHFDHRLYPAVDAADATSCRPDFAVVLYPGYLAIPPTGQQDFSPKGINAVPSAAYTPNSEIHPDKTTPPTFLLQAEDDPVHVENAVVYFLQLKQADVPAELHVYAEGGHGYGLRPTALPITHWPTLVETWLHTIAILPHTDSPRPPAQP